MGPCMPQIQHVPTSTRERQGTAALGRVEEESRQERVAVVPVLELPVTRVEDVAVGEAMVELGAAGVAVAMVAVALVVVAAGAEVVDFRELSIGWRAWCPADRPRGVDLQNRQVCSRQVTVLIWVSWVFCYF